MPDRTFKSVSVDSRRIKRWKAPIRAGGPEAIHLRVPVSSLSLDRDGDQFSEKGLASLIAQYKTGRVPLFANHGRGPSGYTEYRFEDIFGAWVGGEIENGTLFAECVLDPYDWRSDVLDMKIQAGIPLGWSVGFIPKLVQPRKGEGGGGYVFDEVDLLETSVVGIPANPDAVSNAIAAIAKSLIAAEVSMPDVKDEKQEEKPEGDDKPEEKPEDEEKFVETVEVITTDQVRDIVASVVAEQLAPIKEQLQGIAEVKALLEKAATRPETKTPTPRGIVVVRDRKETTPAPAEGATMIRH